MLMPRETVPGLSVPLLGGGSFDIATADPGHATLITFFRGLHCPICVGYLKELERLTPQFAEKGVETVAISSDSEERSAQMAEKVGTSALRMGHSLPLQVARDWGLYISTGIGQEPAFFSEPGLFVVNKDRSLYFGSVQTMPFARPAFGDLLGAFDFVIAKNYPARGEYAGELPSAA
ncbi:MAG: peroxiredoxin-like family protein [Pseudomonadota bacterium]